MKPTLAVLTLVVFILMGSLAVSDHTPHRNRISHDWDIYTFSNTYGTAIDRDSAEVMQSRSRASTKHDNGDQRWAVNADLKCYNVNYKGTWAFANFVPHEISDVRGRASGRFTGEFFKNSRTIGLRQSLTGDCRQEIKRCGAAGRITGWRGNPQDGSLTFADSSIPW